MSYEGYAEYKCKCGDTMTADVYDEQPTTCGCGKPFVVSRSVDQTNDPAEYGEWRSVGLAATAWTPFGPQPLAANDNRTLLVGLTGKRNVGKTTVADLLEEEFGFSRAHAFDGGKEASFAYFKHVTGDEGIARRMVWGDLKDRPSPYLPGNVAPRYFLERFGHFMGADLGVEWTLAMEIGRLRRISPRTPIVVESLVYEAPWFKAQGGFVVRVERPGHEGSAGVESDAVQAAVAADATISATTLPELIGQARRLFARHVDDWELAG